MREHPIQVNVGDPGVKPRARSEGDPDVVSLLRSMLERAERGELTSVALAGQTSDGCVATAYALGKAGMLFSLVGATTALQRRLLTETADDD